MDYSQVILAVQQYSNRDDLQDVNGLFVSMVESMLNKRLKINDNEQLLSLTLVSGQNEYDLPEDFGGIRSAKVDGSTVSYVTPEQIDTREEAYTIVSGKLQVVSSGTSFDMSYYRHVPSLSDAGDDGNWLSNSSPEVYIFGTLVEVASYTKDMEALQVWKARFDEAIAEIIKDDWHVRWGSSPLNITLG